MNKFQNAVGRKLSSATTEAMTDQSLLPSLDNHHTKKYNNCDNFEWHKAHPLSGAKFSRGAATLRLTPTAIISDFSFRILKNTIKSLFLPILAIMLSLNLAYADDPQPTQPPQAEESELEKLEKEIFTKSDDFKVEGACQPTCRAVSDSYIALINDFDPTSGITTCGVYQRDLDYTTSIGFNANTRNQSCVDSINDKLIEVNKKYSNIKSNNFATFVQNDENALKGKVTVSNIIGGIFTLDPKIVNIETTKSNGLLKFQGEIETTIDESANFLNTANLGMFVGGFANIEKLYRKLLNWLLVFIGAYFLFTIFADMLNSKLEKKDYHFKVLNGFLIPVVAFAVFFMPIQQSDNMHSTIFQKLTRYFVQEGIKVADLATLHFQNAYLNMLYNDLGIISVERQRTTEIGLEAAKKEKDFLKSAYNQCKKAFKNIKSFQIYDKAEQYKNKDYISSQLTNNRIYSFEGCQNIERKLLLLEKNIGTYSNEMQFATSSETNEKIAENLKEYNELLNKTIVDKGWISAMIMPSNQIFIDSLLDSNERQSLLNKTQSIDLEEENQKNKVSDGMNISVASALGTGKLAYLILPGAGAMFNHMIESAGSYDLATLKKKKTKKLGFIAKKVGKLSNGVSKSLGGIPIIGGFLSGAVDMATEVIKIELALMAIENIYDTILENLPILTASVAAVIALISYLITLFKFYYLSPVMLMYAVTSKRKDKINDFLVTGITVFLKPLLIVLFLFLAVIFYNILQDLFILQNIEQFLLMAGIAGPEYGGQINSITMSVLQVLMKILSCIAAMYIMFQLIYYGPDRLLKLIGVNNGDDGLISGL
ncbi:MAG: hypothetical protein II923_04135, partial [Campylobacter sp.]|nr:hypothetical protein [Campylobacter sp.]